MNYSNQSTRISGLLIIPVLAFTWLILEAHLQAAKRDVAQQNPAGSQQLFVSPDEAIKALQAVTQANDRAALLKLFGPDFPELSTGDAVQDANNAKGLAARMAQNCRLVKDGENKITLV